MSMRVLLRRSYADEESPAGGRSTSKAPSRPASLRAAETLALTTTRRQFLGKVLARAFVVGASAAMVDTLFADYAAANHTACQQQVAPRCSCCGNPPSGCHQNCKNRPYSSGRCGSGGNCWVEGSKRCCDCCCHPGCTNLNDCSRPGHRCDNCTGCGSGTWKRCVCIYNI